MPMNLENRREFLKNAAIAAMQAQMARAINNPMPDARRCAQAAVNYAEALLAEVDRAYPAGREADLGV